MITDHIPLTATGKVAVYQIVNSDVKGTKYKVEPIRIQNKLLDVQLLPVPTADNGPGQWSGVPDELVKEADIMGKFFSVTQNGFQPPQGFQMPQMPQGFRMPQMPQGFPFPNMPAQGKNGQTEGESDAQAKPGGMQMPNLGPIMDLLGKLFNASTIDHFFED